MRRTLAFILSAVLLFGMVPASFLTALADDNGLNRNDILNQSYNNADTQYIPESVVVDGIVDNDTAWANHDWNEVDTNNGTWDKETPAEASKSLTYKYQLHYDQEYFYGAFVVDALDAEVTVWLKDGSNASGGYSHKIVYTVANGAVTGESFVDYNGNAVTADAPFAAQRYIKAGKKNGNSFTIEFRRFLTSFTSAKASDVKYYVSVKVGGDSLYFPRIRTSGELPNTLPSSTSWPIAVDDSNHLTCQQDKDILSPVTIDGKFDEAMWSGLTNFHYSDKDINITDPDDANRENINFDDVHYNGTYQPSANSASDKYLVHHYDGADHGSMSGDPRGDLNTNNSLGKGEVKFKYVYRVDGEYFYCAIVADIPKLLYEGFPVMGKDGVMSSITSNPTVTMLFYNQTGKYYTDVANTVATNVKSNYNGWAPEHMISINTVGKDSDTNSGGFVNVSARVNGDGYVDGMWWSPQAGDDTKGQDVSAEATGFKAAYAKQGEYTDELGYKSSVWYFETRVKLDAIKSSAALAGTKTDDLYFTISISDRPWVDAIDSNDAESRFKGGYKYYSDVANDVYTVAKNYYRNSAWTGTDNSVKSAYYFYKNGHHIKDSDCKGSFIPGIVVDSNLDKQNLSALIGADSRIDGVDRVVQAATKLTDSIYGDYNVGGYDIPTAANGLIPASKDDGYYCYNDYNGIQYTYNIAADYENLYFAIALHNLKDEDGFRLWLKSADSTLAGYETAIAFSYNAGTANELIVSSWYDGATGTNILSGRSDYDFAWTIDEANSLMYVEFRVALDEVGLTPTLDPQDNQLLCTYFVTAEDYAKHGNQTTSNNNGLVHPRCEGTFPSNWDLTHAGRIFYSAPNASYTGRGFDHHDSIFLNFVNVDGKLDEAIWDSESDRIVVQGNNGQWSALKDSEGRYYSNPGRNDIFEYSYVLYVGDNYIYGAVELNEEAVAATDENYNYGMGKFTSIELWLANPGSYDEWGVYYNEHEYDNYYYNMYFCSEDYSKREYAVSGPSGLVFGGTAPQVDSDYYKWGMTVENGKTYAEFMIALDSYQTGSDGVRHSRFNMSETAGADYYISVKHPTEEETLTLTHPVPAEMFYLTHYEDIYQEGAGVIYTDLNNDASNANEYLDSKGRWWTHAMFVPDTASGGWKFVASKDGVRSLTADEIAKQNASDGAQYQGHYGFLPSEIAANPGCIIYCVNTGNNYPKVLEDLKVSFNNKAVEMGYDPNNLTSAQRLEIMTAVTAIVGGVEAAYINEKKAGLQLNYVSSYAEQMRTTIFTWKPGDIIKIPGLVSGKDVGTQAKALIQAQNNAQVEAELVRFVNEYALIPDNMKGSVVKLASFVDPSKTIEWAAQYIEVAKPRYYEAGFRNTIYYTRVTENTAWDDKLPSASYWYGSNEGTLDALEHIAPEKITVDGILNDSGWSEDGWITVDDAVNASALIDSADKFGLKYQLRFDGEYVYVAAVFEGVKYDATNAPVFTLWTKDDSDANWSKYYRVGYNTGKNYALKAEIPNRTDFHSVSSDVIYTNLETSKNSVVYNNDIDVVKNNNPSKADINTAADSLGYMDSLFYGYTDTVEELVSGKYYPNIDMGVYEYIFGTEAAVMNSDMSAQISGLGNYNDTATVVEFRIDLKEIDADSDGFEYFVSATRKDAKAGEYTVYYPNVSSEPDSEFSYYTRNFPFWKWYSETSAKVTADDLKYDLYLVNQYSPVVTLGAKFNDNFDGNGSNAIRFGAKYTESLIRRQSGDKTTDYWEVDELGMLIIATNKLGTGEELTLSTEGVITSQSVGIVNWQENSNFADYESFAFYVTVNGIPEVEAAKNLKFSARSYITYYDVVNYDDGKTHGTNAPDCYGDTIVRSVNMINAAVSNEGAVLPD